MKFPVLPSSLALLLALCSTFVSPALLRAEGVLFYQPLNRDRSVTSDEWRQIWREANRRKYKQIIVQWTAFGSQNFDQDTWLINTLKLANQAGLDLILGLYADPQFSQTILQAGWEDRFDEYWVSLQRRSLSHQKKLLPLLTTHNVPVKGWYFPSELSDRFFTSIRRRKFVRQELSLMASQLNRPLHVSAYSLGYLSPQATANWLSSLQESGLEVWWQDGSGVFDLPAPALQAYRDILPCSVGIVREAFIRVSPQDSSFAAEPVQPKDYPSCYSSAVFSLRYMPWVDSLLSLEDPD